MKKKVYILVLYIICELNKQFTYIFAGLLNFYYCVQILISINFCKIVNLKKIILC